MWKLKGKSCCSQPKDTAQQPNVARGQPSTPAWARSPATNGWVGQAAKLLNPTGLYLAHGGLQPSAAVDLEIDSQQPSRRFRAVYKPGAPWGNPRSLHFLLLTRSPAQPWSRWETASPGPRPWWAPSPPPCSGHPHTSLFAYPRHSTTAVAAAFLPLGRRVCWRRWGAAPPGPRPRQAPPFLLVIPAPPPYHFRLPKSEDPERNATHGGSVEMAVLLPPPSPASASTPTVSAPPSSGPVVAPVTPVPHADEAAVSFGSVSPARQWFHQHDGGVSAAR
jgi:hypothetical protein